MLIFAVYTIYACHKSGISRIDANKENLMQGVARDCIITNLGRKI